MNINGIDLSTEEINDWYEAEQGNLYSQYKILNSSTAYKIIDIIFNAVKGTLQYIINFFVGFSQN
jgi:hypothetical protein